jgi:hypothetical protein
MADYTKEHWFLLLLAAVESDPRGRQGVADRLGISRTQVSLAISGKYGNPINLAKRVLHVMDRHLCRYIGAPVTDAYCREVNDGPAPIWDPSGMDQRRVCQTCPHKPKQGDRK